MIGGVGTRIAEPEVRRKTASAPTSSRKGKSASSRSGKSSRSGAGLRTAPERQWSPTADALSSTPISICESPPVEWSSRASRADSITPARPAGPPPTKRTSRGTASSPGSLSRMTCLRGRSGFRRDGSIILVELALVSKHPPPPKIGDAHLGYRPTPRGEPVRAAVVPRAPGSEE